MTDFPDSFLIRCDRNTLTQKTSDHEWLFTVSENGCFNADFLETSSDLKVKVILAGSHATCQLRCAYLSNDNNKINIDFNVLHEHPETTSSQYIRGLATGSSAVTFNGVITIPHDSQKCDGHQNHRGIVLSDTAKISATPQLEIWADDVKCAHGSAVGPLNPEEIFYLESRGLSETEAKKLLLSSFFGDFIAPEFDSFIQDWIDRYV